MDAETHPAHQARSSFVTCLSRLVSAAAGCLVAFGPLACGTSPTSDSQNGGAPSLRALDTLVLQDRGDLTVGRPGALVIGPDRDFYVSDVFSDHIVRFDRNGVAVKVYGSPGDGPGEFRSLGSTLFVTHALVGAGDLGSGSVLLFSKRTGRYLSSRRVDGVTTSAAVNGDSIWLGTIGTSVDSAVVVWSPHDLSGRKPFQSSDRELIPNILALPLNYRSNPTLRFTYGLTSVVSWGDTVLIGLGASRAVWETSLRDGPVRSLRIPATRRRGVPDNLVRRASLQVATIQDLFSMTSVLMGLYRAPSGRVTAVHFDFTLKSLKARLATARVYVSLLSPDLREACVDRIVPTDTLAEPVTTVKGDTLFVLEQHLRAPEHDVAETVIEPYLVDPRGCSWLPTLPA